MGADVVVFAAELIEPPLVVVGGLLVESPAKVMTPLVGRVIPLVATTLPEKVFVAEINAAGQFPKNNKINIF